MATRTARKTREEKVSLREWIEAKFEGIDHKFEAVHARIDGVKSELTMIKWFIGIGFTAILAVLGIILNVLLKK